MYNICVYIYIYIHTCYNIYGVNTSFTVESEV